MLQPLQLLHVRQLIADTFRYPLEECTSLAQLTRDKTQGNPFFILIFLTNLVQQSIIQFNHSKGKWMWDMSKIREMHITDNVVQMTTQRIQRLRKETQTILSLAAAIGNKFDMSTLAVISKKSLLDVAKALWPAVKGSGYHRLSPLALSSALLSPLLSSLCLQNLVACVLLLPPVDIKFAFFFCFRWLDFGVWRRIVSYFRISCY